MSTRKVKDAVDIKTNEVIYFKGHAKATYMTNGTSVEDAINLTDNKIESKQDIITDLDVIRSGAIKGETALQSVPSEYITETELNSKNYATASQLSSKQDKINDLDTIRSGASKGATAVQPSSLSIVATSGSYDDLSNKPTIPDAVTETTVSNWGFTKNTGTYSKPNGGIPKSDLAGAVQTSLGKADTALQSYTEQFKGTVTVGDTVETLDDVYGSVDLTPYATKVDLTSKQNNLVSGDNIKTINGESILGGGDIKIGNKKLVSFTEGTITLAPNTYYRNTNTSLSALTITLGTITDDTIFNEFFIEFTTRSSGTTVALPSTIKWVNGIAPVFDNGSTYQISIVNNWGVCVKFA